MSTGTKYRIGTAPKLMGKNLLRKINDTHKKWSTDKTSKKHVYENVDYNKQKSDKLKTVIDNFDKILDEHKKYEKKEPTKIPKLQKAKTCIIIESKCILKKSLSNPLDHNKSSRLQTKTKSLGNIVDDSTPVTKNSISKVENKLQARTKSFVAPPTKTPKIEPSSGKVKEVVRRLNSLTDGTPEAKAVKDISKSTMDLSKKCSKIPVKTNLRKSFESTPCGLNTLDRNTSSTTKKGTTSLNGRFTKSVHNLAAKPLVKDKGLGKSVQNLNKLDTKGSTTRLSLPAKNVQKPVTKERKRDFVAPAKPPETKKKLEPKKVDKPKAPTKVAKKPEVVEKKVSKGLKDKVEQFSCPPEDPEPETFVVLKKPSEELVKNVVDKLEQDTFAKHKHTFEPKFVGQDKIHVDIDYILDMKPKKFVANIVNKYSTTPKREGFQDIRNKFENFDYGRKFDYTSDENSDDSGNISNEIELEMDCDSSSSVKTDSIDEVDRAAGKSEVKQNVATPQLGKVSAEFNFHNLKYD